jgi:hypothetical protein
MAEKTTSTFGGLGAAITSKLGDMRDNAAFKSFEEKLSSTVDAVKVKNSYCAIEVDDYMLKIPLRRDYR